MAESQSKKYSTIFPHAWFKSLEKLPDDVAGRIYKAVHRLDITGEMTFFEEGSIEDILFSQYAFQTKGFKQSYAETCDRKSQAAKKREERKKAQKAQQGTAEPKANSSVDDRMGCDVSGWDGNGMDVSGCDVSGDDDSAPQAHTTTTAPDFDEILMTWNNQPVTNKIVKIGDSGKRHDRTEMAVAVAGGHGAFLNAIRSLKDQGYFQNRQRDGYKVDYDWFIDPDNFQNVLEGKYEKSRDKFGDGWEVVEFG